MMVARSAAVRAARRSARASSLTVAPSAARLSSGLAASAPSLAPPFDQPDPLHGWQPAQHLGDGLDVRRGLGDQRPGA